jgi:protein translocase SecG subunit
LQQRGSSLGGAFGGDNFSSAFHKRRGAELFLFKFSVGIAILFVVSTLLAVLA